MVGSGATGILAAVRDARGRPARRWISSPRGGNAPRLDTERDQNKLVAEIVADHAAGPDRSQGLAATGVGKSHVAYKVGREVGAQLIVITGPDKTVSHHGKLYDSHLVVKGGVRKAEISDYLDSAGQRVIISTVQSLHKGRGHPDRAGPVGRVHRVPLGRHAGEPGRAVLPAYSGPFITDPSQTNERRRGADHALLMSPHCTRQTAVTYAKVTGQASSAMRCLWPRQEPSFWMTPEQQRHDGAGRRGDHASQRVANVGAELAQSAGDRPKKMLPGITKMMRTSAASAESLV